MDRWNQNETIYMFVINVKQNYLKVYNCKQNIYIVLDIKYLKKWEKY